ncbi:sialic acid-binding Ig-like lectin 15 [Heterodontus francisci]|uniref:sialic acid-binding Ig-like lectin 15 n=1 Tax=Heterodontus francisci TaxID=7792 RepID=UPI00355BF913
MKKHFDQLLYFGVKRHEAASEKDETPESLVMRFLYVWLSAVLLSVSVRGYKVSANGWTMSAADDVSVEEGGSAVLPCTFTHPHTDQTVTGSVIWYKGRYNVIFKCIYSGPGHSQSELCENVIQQDGGNRFRFVGNFSNKDVSIMMERLIRADSGPYQCRVELTVGKFQTQKLTSLRVEAASGNVSVVTGTEGASVTLPCMFTPRERRTLSTVTWMRKEPYQHIVTFRNQSNGSWTTANGGNRDELIGNPKEGNASTRINQLSVNDNHTYLCLVEYTLRSNYQHLIQTETQLLVVHAAETFPIAILCIPLGVKLLALIVMWIILLRDKSRKEQD